MSDDFVFDGFEPANTTPVPDVLFDELLTELSGSELKVLLYIIRRTRGFKKDTDAISLNQFQRGIKTREGKVLDKGCGISDRKTIIVTLNSLEAKGCIQRRKSKTAQGDSDTSVYRIRFKEVVGNSNHPVPLGSGKFQPPLVGNSNHGSRENPLRVVGNSNPQETVLQDTENKESVYEDTTTPPTDSTPPDTHTLFLNSSTSESQDTTPPSSPVAIGNDAVPHQQTHRAGTAMSANVPCTADVPTPSFPPSTAAVRGTLPSTDSNLVGSPPADDKSQTNKQPLSKQELALRRQWKKYVCEDVSRETVIVALQLRDKWLTAYGPYGDAEWDNQALLWIAQQQNGSWENVARVYRLWEEKEPSKPIHPEMVKNKWFWLNEKQPQQTVSGRKRLEVPEDILAALKGKPS